MVARRANAPNPIAPAVLPPLPPILIGGGLGNVLVANLPPVVGTKGEIVESVTGIFVVGTVRC